MCAAKIFRKKKADAKDRVIADLRRQPDHRDKEIAELRAQVAALLARVTELEAKLNQNSSNSSRPPSSDPPGAPPPAPKKRSGRKPGGQPGHKGKSRKLLPEGDVDEFHDHKPTECRGCGKRLHGADAAPLRHQVTEIPPITPHVSEHRLHALRCSCCDEVTRAVLPQGISRGAFGTRLQSVASVLSGAYRLSKRNVESLLADLFGVELSLGSIKALEDQTSAALAAPVEEAQRWVKEHPCAQLDETGWRHQNKRSWLWTAVAGPVASFLIRSSRAGKIAKELVGECFGGVVCSDRWSAYNWIDVLHRQICWAHLKRDFRKIAEMGGVAEALGEALEAQTKELFKHWHRVRDGTLKRSSFSVYASRIRVEVRALLGAGMGCCVSKASGMCKQILKVERAMWTFVRIPGVEPTNNAAERALRHAVIWRKTSFGTQSEAGRSFVERMLTTVTSLRLQHRNVLEYVTEACRSAQTRTVAPTLLPATLPSQG